MQISASFRRRNTPWNVWKDIWTMPQGGAICVLQFAWICLKIQRT